MHSGYVTVAAIHNLSLAAAYGGALFSKAALNKSAIQGVSNEKERGKVIQIAWSEWNKVNVPAHIAFAATWVIARNAIAGRHTGRTTQRLIAIKDALTAGALVTGVLNTMVGNAMKREFPEGVPIPAEGNLPPEQVERVARYMSYYRVMGPIHRVLLGGSIAIGPAIGASILRTTGRSFLARLFGLAKH